MSKTAGLTTLRASTVRKALYRKVDQAVDGVIAIWIIAASVLIPAAMIKAALLYLIH